jgi:hypothetical protein
MKPNLLGEYFSLQAGSLWPRFDPAPFVMPPSKLLLLTNLKKKQQRKKEHGFDLHLTSICCHNVDSS